VRLEGQAGTSPARSGSWETCPIGGNSKNRSNYCCNFDFMIGGNWEYMSDLTPSLSKEIRELDCVNAQGFGE